MCMEISAPSTAPAAVGAPKHSSLQVELFPPEIAKECSKISRPTVRYIVKYKKTKCLGTLCHREKVNEKPSHRIIIDVFKVSSYLHQTD